MPDLPIAVRTDVALALRPDPPLHEIARITQEAGTARESIVTDGAGRSALVLGGVLGRIVVAHADLLAAGIVEGVPVLLHPAIPVRDYLQTVGDLAHRFQTTDSDRLDREAATLEGPR
jgi:hypothetical protein